MYNTFCMIDLIIPILTMLVPSKNWTFVCLFLENFLYPCGEFFSIKHATQAVLSILFQIR